MQSANTCPFLVHCPMWNADHMCLQYVLLCSTHDIIWYFSLVMISLCISVNNISVIWHLHHHSCYIEAYHACWLLALLATVATCTVPMGPHGCHAHTVSVHMFVLYTCIIVHVQCNAQLYSTYGIRFSGVYAAC